MKTDSLRVARIRYLNTDPFFAGWEEGDFSFVSASPRQLGRWAAEGKLDAGPIPLVDYWKLEAEFEPVGPFGIAMTGPVQSVLLFSKKPVENLGRVGLTEESSTSVNLLKILLKNRYRISPAFGPFSPSDDAQLVIGDEALKQLHGGRPGFPSIIDLGQEWHDWKKLPFIFARWVIRRTVPSYLKDELAERLDKNLRHFGKNPGPVAAAGAKRLGLSEKIVGDYLSGLTYRFGPKEEAGEKTFREYFTGLADQCLC